MTSVNKDTPHPNQEAINEIDEHLKEFEGEKSQEGILYRHVNEYSLYIRELKTLLDTMAIKKLIPADFLGLVKSKDELEFVEAYADSLRNTVALIKKHGNEVSLESYSFRLPHIERIAKTINVVSRLQFVKQAVLALKGLNNGLDNPEWGLLLMDTSGKYTLNGEVVDIGTGLDMMTIEGEVKTGLEFQSNAILNCATPEGESVGVLVIAGPIGYNLSKEQSVLKADNFIPGDQYMLGVDAWSVLEGLFFRKSVDKEIIYNPNEVFVHYDLHPEIEIEDFNDFVTFIKESDKDELFSKEIIDSLMTLFIRDVETFKLFKNNVTDFYKGGKKEIKKFIKKISKIDEKMVGAGSITPILHNDRSKIYHGKVLTFSGEIHDVLMIDRPICTTPGLSFNRFSIDPIVLYKIGYPKVKKDSNIKRNRQPFINFDGSTISQADVLVYLIAEHTVDYMEFSSNDVEPPADVKHLFDFYKKVKFNT